MTCVIFCGGRIEDYSYIKGYVRDAGFIISADSGARHCLMMGIVPDMLVGDFDSVGSEDFSALKNAGAEVVRYPKEKDMTDSELAVDIALERGCSKVILLGAAGSRLDHSVSNLFLLKKLLDAGVDGFIADEKNEVRLIRDSITLKRENGVYVTLLALSGSVSGVTTRGLYYPLDNAILYQGSSRGVSNRFSEDEAYVEVKDGDLLVILSHD